MSESSANDIQANDRGYVKKRNWRRIIFGCVVAIFVMTLVCVAATFATLYWFEETLGDLPPPFCATNEPNRIANTENIAEFKFPPSANIIFTYCGGMQGWGASAQFEMLPDDLDTFIASTHLTRDTLTTQAPQPTPGQFSVIEHTENMTSYLYGQYQRSEFRQEILIDTSNPNLYLVYIAVSGG